MLLYDLFKVINYSTECEILTIDNEQLYMGEISRIPNKLMFYVVYKITIVSPLFLIIRVHN